MEFPGLGSPLTSASDATCFPLAAVPAFQRLGCVVLDSGGWGGAELDFRVG